MTRAPSNIFQSIQIVQKLKFLKYFKLLDSRITSWFTVVSASSFFFLYFSYFLSFFYIFSVFSFCFRVSLVVVLISFDSLLLSPLILLLLGLNFNIFNFTNFFFFFLYVCFDSFTRFSFSFVISLLCRCFCFILLFLSYPIFSIASAFIWQKSWIDTCLLFFILRFYLSLLLSYIQGDWWLVVPYY